GADGVADLLEVLDRLDDDVADDDPAAGHGEQGGDQGGGQQPGAVDVDGVGDGVGAHADADDGQQVVLGRPALAAPLGQRLVTGQAALVGADGAVVKQHPVAGGQPRGLVARRVALGELLEQTVLEAVLEVVLAHQVELVLAQLPQLADVLVVQVPGALQQPEVELLVLLALEIAHVLHGQERVDQQAAGGGRLVVGQVLGLVGVQPEAAGDQQQDEGAEQEAALALQAGFAEQTLEGAVRHTIPRGLRTRTACAD